MLEKIYIDGFRHFNNFSLEPFAPANQPQRFDESESCKVHYRAGVKYTQLGKQLAEIEMLEESEFPESLWATRIRIKDKKLFLGL